LILIPSAFGTDYEKYFAAGGSGSTCSSGSPCAFSSINDEIDNDYTSSGNTLTIYLNSSDTWTLTSNTGIQVDKANIMIDGETWGGGTRATIDGDGTYPNDKNYNVITIGGASASETVSNITIKGVRIQNTHDTVSTDEGGSGIFFSGSQHFGNTALVTNCYIKDMGWAAINIYKVVNSGGSSTAIKIENNYIDGTGWYPENAGVTGPQAINSTSDSSGHEARYNVIVMSHNEGIGVEGFSVVEYNTISNTDNPAIYYDPGSSTKNTTTTIRYNLIWRDNDIEHANADSDGIRIYDESSTGTNTGITINIYGNVIVGNWYSGIRLQNVSENSNFGTVRVFGNTVVDTKRNFVVAYPQLFNEIDIRNNVSIINSDVAESSQHWAEWNKTSYPESTIIGPNYWYGDGFTSESDLPADWRDGTNIFGSGTQLGKTSGWTSLTTIPSLNDFTPQTGSDMIDNAATDDTIGAEYDDYIIEGEFADLPETESLTTATQASRGADWDFGAILYNLFVSNMSPGQGDTDVSITVDLNWSNPTGATGINLYFDKKADHDPPTTLRIDNQDVETWDCGTLDYNTEYALRADVVHAGGTETGTVYYFTTTIEQNPPAPSGSGIKFLKKGVAGRFLKKGVAIGD